MIFELSEITPKTRCGVKARNLSTLSKLKINIPRTFIIPFDVFKAFQQEKQQTLNKITTYLEEKIDTTKSYAIRSSANVEDTTLFSFAGQFTTSLNITGIKPIITAIKQTWRSAQNQSVNSYQLGLNRSSSEIKMAVIIQEMVNPVFSGVVFTRNPITGLDEVIVETVDGYGDTLVQKGVTPNRWVSKWGNWIEKPQNHDDRVDIIQKIITEAKTIAKKVGYPVDLEWVYNGEQVIWLQMREITTLQNTNIYSNKISKEFLPGIIKPLVWSVNIPVVNNSWKQLFIEMIGKRAESIDVNNLAKSFYYRAYFNMGVIGDIFELLGMPREALEILAGIEVSEKEKPRLKLGLRSIRYLPRMFVMGVRMLLFDKQIFRFLQDKRRQYQELYRINILELDISTIFQVIDSLFKINSESSYYVIVSQLLNNLYNRVLRSQLEKHEIQYDDIEFNKVKKRLAPIDPMQQLAVLKARYLKLGEKQQALLKTISWQEALQHSDLVDFKPSLEDYLRRFGHLSDSGNDFSKPTWKEDDHLILRMMINFNLQVPKKTQKIVQNKLEILLSQNLMLRMIYNRATKYQEYRESVNFLYTFGYGLFRRFLKRLEQLLLKRSLLQEEDDIFYLEYLELKSLVKNPSKAKKLKHLILKRKKEIERYRDINLPQVIYNELPESSLTKWKVLRDLKGVATSKGYYIGRVKIVRGTSDFTKITKGNVLVIPYSDVSWTPLFSKAGAVVSESGGILSHCSIVAREYQIPAVVSVQDAMGLTDNVLLAVNGYTGEVQILDDE